MLPEFADWAKLPPAPSYPEGLHPIAVHLPIALLLIAPLFVFLAMVLFKKGRWFSVAALLLLALGTGGAYLAIETGEHDRDAVEDGSDEMFEVLEKHEEVAEAILPVFGILTGVYLAILVLPFIIRPLAHPAVLFLLNLAFLVVLAGALLLVINAGHLGGRLVHEFGVRSAIGEPEVKKEEPKEEPKDKPEAKKEEPKEEPKDKPEVKKEEPKEEPKDKPEAKKEEPKEEPKDKPEVKKEEPKEEPKDKPEVKKEEPKEEPKDKPEVKKEEPKEESKDKPEVKKEEPKEEPKDKPEVKKEEPKGESSEKE